jgi:hypothetical protein
MIVRSKPRLAGLCATLAACTWLAGCDNAPKPTTPTTPATVTALAVSAPPASVKAGDTFQLTATATLSNGQTATSGFTVAWTSSDETIATVNAAGLVSAKADGRATISASANAVRSSVDFTVRGGRTFTGLVTESAPTTAVVVAGARVTVVDGLYAGASATTDLAGSFTLSDVNGVLTLRVSAPNFDDAQVSADTAGAGGLTVRLTPANRNVTDSADFASSWGGPDQRWQGTLTFNMHRSGRVDVLTAASLSTGESAPLCSEMRDADNKIIWSVQTPWQTGARDTLSLDGGKRYTIKINDCGFSKVPIVYSYKLTATHPY